MRYIATYVFIVLMILFFIFSIVGLTKDLNLGETIIMDKPLYGAELKILEIETSNEYIYLYDDFTSDLIVYDLDLEFVAAYDLLEITNYLITNIDDSGTITVFENTHYYYEINIEGEVINIYFSEDRPNDDLQVRQSREYEINSNVYKIHNYLFFYTISSNESTEFVYISVLMLFPIALVVGFIGFNILQYKSKKLSQEADGV